MLHQFEPTTIICGSRQDERLLSEVKRYCEQSKAAKKKAANKGEKKAKAAASKSTLNRSDENEEEANGDDEDEEDVTHVAHFQPMPTNAFGGSIASD